MKRRTADWFYKLNEALRGHGHRSIQDLAILVTEDGRLKAMPALGQPRYLEWLESIPTTGVTRKFTRNYIQRYIRTDLVCQTGHRIYVLNEVRTEDSLEGKEDADEQS